MRKLFALCALVLLSACATTGMYDAPSGDDVAVIRIQNEMDSGASQQGQGGWVMPGANTAPKVGLFTIDGERLDETGGDQKVKVEAGKHRVEIFADGGGALRFKKFSLKVEAGGDYLVRVNRAAGDDASFTAQVVDAAAPDVVIKEVAF